MTLTDFGVETSEATEIRQFVAVNFFVVSVDAIYAVADTVDEFWLSFFVALHVI